MYEVGVVETFDAAHRLRGDFGPATQQHGHAYRVEVTVRGPSLRADGTLCDISELQQAVRAVLVGLHDRDLNALPAFAEKNSTAEEVAGHLLRQLTGSFNAEGVERISVRVWESPDAFAACDGPARR